MANCMKRTQDWEVHAKIKRSDRLNVFRLRIPDAAPFRSEGSWCIDCTILTVSQAQASSPSALLHFYALIVVSRKIWNGRQAS